jgi:hypothetical protein
MAGAHRDARSLTSRPVKLREDGIGPGEARLELGELPVRRLRLSIAGKCGVRKQMSAEVRRCGVRRCRARSQECEA